MTTPQYLDPADRAPVTAPASAATAPRRGLRRQILIGAAVILVAVGGTVWGLLAISKTSTGCDSLTRAIGTGATPVTLVVELQGNTADDASRVSTFVQSELIAATGDFATSYDVRLILVRYGTPAPMSGCLSAPRRITSPATDLTTYTDPHTSPSNKKTLAATLRDDRTRQIGWIASAASADVRGTTFAGRNAADPVLSPLVVWKAADAYDLPGSVLALYSPLLSTRADCLQTPLAATSTAAATSSSVTMADSRVQDCLRFKQLAPAAAKFTSIVADTTLLSPAQRSWAEATRIALCRRATTDNCSITPSS